MTRLREFYSACNVEDTVELSHSLRDCLADIIVDIERIETDGDIDGLIERISVSAMNCLADMHLLRSTFVALDKLRHE